MRSSRLGFGICLLLLVTCGGLTHLTVDQKASATIPGATLFEQLVSGALSFSGFSGFDISQTQELKNQGVKREQINSVKLTSLTIDITAPANGQDFGFLKTIAFFVEANGQAKKQVAHGGPFAVGAHSISLTLDDVELAPYAAAPSMTFTTTATGNKPMGDTTLEAKVSLGVDVNVAGAICGAK